MIRKVCFFGPKKMLFMQTESVLQTKNRSGPTKNRFSVALVWRCAHGLDIISWINFFHFFHFVNFVIFWPQILWKCIDSGYLVSATPYTTSCLSLCYFAHLVFHGLKMCIWFEFNPAVNFCHFSILLPLSVFAGATSTSPKFDLFYFILVLWDQR